MRLKYEEDSNAIRDEAGRCVALLQPPDDGRAELGPMLAAALPLAQDARRHYCPHCNCSCRGCGSCGSTVAA